MTDGGAHFPVVHLCCIITTTLTFADLARDAMLLDMEETEKHRRFVAVEDRRDYAAAHALVRRMLTVVAPGIPAKEWRFERTAHGKPYVAAAMAGAPPLRFSISHTRGHVVCAVSRHSEVGVDIQCRSQMKKMEIVMPDVCSDDEQAQIRAAEPSAQADCFLDLWSLKEAYLKACGTGIDVRLDRISFDLRQPAMIFPSLRNETNESWWFALFKPSSEARIAVAIAANSQTVVMLDSAIVRRDGAHASLHPTRTSGPFTPSRAVATL
jgi:4'-phosphopantetheinyl transferase